MSTEQVFNAVALKNNVVTDIVRSGSIDLLKKNNNTTLAMRHVFDLCTTLIKCEYCHSLTVNVLNAIQQFSGVVAVKSYEVFESCVDSRYGKNKIGRCYRKFPFADCESEQDDGINLVSKIIDQSGHPVSEFESEGRHFLLLDVKEVVPRRIVLVEGELDACQQNLIEGLFSVYAAQVSLLDKKERDPLTHLLNRYSLDYIFNQVADYDSADQDETCSDKKNWVAIVDIDDFKNVNDNHGHLVGDEVLIQMANIMKSNLRFSDFIFRYGGEEFLILLNETNNNGALSALERFRTVVESHNFPAGQITVSVGFTRLDNNKSLANLLEEADKAVYAAKRQGKNQVVYTPDSIN